MKPSAMEIIEAPAEKPASFVHRSDWLQSTIKGVNEKMKAILDTLENYDSPLQNAEIYGRNKEKITEVVQDLCISYRSLAEEHECLKTASINVYTLESSSPSNDRSEKDIDSYPESTVEDAVFECEDTMNELEHMKRFADTSVPKDGSNNKSESVSSEGVRYKISKLVEENTQIQVELIRRNSEKRETIRKLQNQVSRLKAENDTLQRTLSYYNRKDQQIQENSPKRKAVLLEKFFRGCSP